MIWDHIVAFLKEFKARLIAFGAFLTGLVEVLEPDWVVNIVGEENKGWVYIALVGGAFVLHQLIPDNKEDKV